MQKLIQNHNAVVVVVAVEVDHAVVLLEVVVEEGDRAVDLVVVQAVHLVVVRAVHLVVNRAVHLVAKVVVKDVQLRGQFVMENVVVQKVILEFRKLCESWLLLLFFLSNINKPIKNYTYLLLAYKYLNDYFLNYLFKI